MVFSSGHCPVSIVPVSQDSAQVLITRQQLMMTVVVVVAGYYYYYYSVQGNYTYGNYYSKSYSMTASAVVGTHWMKTRVLEWQSLAGKERRRWLRRRTRMFAGSVVSEASRTYYH